MSLTLLSSNIGILLTTFALILILLVLTFFLMLCVSHTNKSKCSRCVFRLNSCLSWNFILRLLIETYLDILLCSLLNASNVGHSDCS